MPTMTESVAVHVMLAVTLVAVIVQRCHALRSECNTHVWICKRGLLPTLPTLWVIEAAWLR
jgi:hypothetical protein